MEMQGVKAQRPMTHDLLKRSSWVWAGPCSVTITGVRENTYFGAPAAGAKIR
jgi:bifunctional DNase/RNase